MSGPHRPVDPLPPRPPDTDPGTPWVETPAGWLFFLNAVLVAPVAMVLFPLVVGWTLRALGILEGPSRLWDPVPAVAAHVGPWLGWLAAVPLALTLRNLTMVERRGPRIALMAFLVAHLGVLCWTAVQWIL
ncbi:MAG: hypothetical protein KY453_08345 [Gemmatimonadetes bacterium]|nr:hypothetical protein [Gemmatimonadota bacterium]